MRKPIQILTGLLVLLAFFKLDAQISVVNDGILTVKEGQLVRINGNFSNYSSQYVNQGDIGLTGNFLNEARVTNPGLGIFRFIGLQEQTVSMFDTLDMFNVELNNPAGMALDGLHHLQVFGNMDFVDGIVDTDLEQMLSYKEGATTSNGSFFSHINGPALKLGINDFVFPVGKEGDYRPAAISQMTNSSTYLMEYIHYPYFWYTHEFEILKVNQEGFWDFNRIVGSEFPKLTITYDQTTNMFTNLDKLEIVHWEDIWNRVPSQSDGATPTIGLTTLDKINEYGFFTTAESRNPAEDVTSINVFQNENCQIEIDWVMPAGTLIQRYEIESSVDSVEFFYVGEVEGSLTQLTELTVYNFVDESLYGETKIYYRLKLVTPEPFSTFSYTPIISVENECPFEDCRIYPNPLNSKNNLKLQMISEADAKMPLKVWDVVGRLMFEQTLDVEAGRRIYEINTSGNRLIAGTYILQLNPRKSLKFIVISE